MPNKIAAGIAPPKRLNQFAPSHAGTIKPKAIAVRTAAQNLILSLFIIINANKAPYRHYHG